MQGIEKLNVYLLFRADLHRVILAQSMQGFPEATASKNNSVNLVAVALSSCPEETGFHSTNPPASR